MTNKTSRNIRICGFVALALCLAWLMSMVANSISVFSSNASSHPIDWSNGAIMKIFVLVCYAASSIAMIGMCAKAVINVMIGLRENTAFPKSNEKLLFWIAAVDFFRLIGTSNFSILWDNDLVMAITPEIFLKPFFLLFFAFMYKVAADAVEENNLTI